MARTLQGTRLNYTGFPGVVVSENEMASTATYLPEQTFVQMKLWESGM